MKRFRILTLLILLLAGLLAPLPAPQKAHAQLDVKHYIPPLHAFSWYAGYNTRLYLSTPSTTPVNVNVVDGAGTVIFAGTISNTAPHYVNVNDSIHNDVSQLNQISTNGFIVTADAPIYANMRSRDSNQGWSLTAKGYGGLGTRFRAGLMRSPFRAGSGYGLFFSVMATEDNTAVRFDDIKPGVVFYGTTVSGSPATTEPIEVSLDAGQSYVIGIPYGTYTGTAPVDDVNGTLITADKPIAVNTGHWLVPGDDMGIDQIVPESILGSEYVLMKGDGTGQLETPVAIATADNTNLSVNGGATTCTNGTGLPMNAGDYCFLDGQFSAQGNMFVQASQPIYIYQTLAGSTSTRTKSLNFIPPISNSSHTFVNNIPDVSYLGSATIGILARSTASVNVNGSPVGVSALPVTGTSNWVTYRVTGLTGNVSVDSSDPIAVQFTNVSGNIGAAGYYAGLPVVVLDFGDLPAAYNLTTLNDDGARHSTSDLVLGTAVDGEDDGQESADASGDDLLDTDDEDGVTVPSPWIDGVNGGQLTVDVSGGKGCLSAWLDWDGDDGFGQAGDQILEMEEVSTGSNNLTFDVPAGIVSGTGFARFRLKADTGTPDDCSDDLDMTPSGLVSSGEVEDHLLPFTVLDSDDDGVPDGSDLCPETPTGETVDANGCSESQMDTDDLPPECGESWHIISSQLRLGADGTLDDGGVFPTILPGGIYAAEVIVTNTSGQPAQLVGWIDFDVDTNFEQAGDRSSPDLVGALPADPAGDSTFTTGNIPTDVTAQSVFLQWTYQGNPPTNTYARLRLTTDPTFFSDDSPQPTGTFGPGETEGHSLSGDPLAVTLAYFLAQENGEGTNGDAVDFEWETTTENGVAGFHLYAEGEATPLNSELIPSPVVDSLMPTAYRFTASTSATIFYVDEIGIDGSSQRHGPFGLGEVYGAYAADSDERQSIFLPVVVQ